jgi:hypothetical protein
MLHRIPREELGLVVNGIFIPDYVKDSVRMFYTTFYNTHDSYDLAWDGEALYFRDKYNALERWYKMATQDERYPGVSGWMSEASQRELATALPFDISMISYIGPILDAQPMYT